MVFRYFKIYMFKNIINVNRLVFKNKNEENIKAVQKERWKIGRRYLYKNCIHPV